jgi:hypothetical protein
MSNDEQDDIIEQLPAEIAELERRWSEVRDFRSSLIEETDRGCALLGASYLDGEIEKLLKDYLVDDTGVAEEIFRPDGPLGSF